MPNAHAQRSQNQGKGDATEGKDLTPGQIEKARSCKTPEEVLELAKEEGIELSDEDFWIR